MRRRRQVDLGDGHETPAEIETVGDHYAFLIGEVFPSDSMLAEWLGTISMAFNDLALIHGQIEVDSETPHKFFYWLRIAIAHFSEAADYLAQTRDIEGVAVFIASLPKDARDNAQRCIDLYARRESEIQQIRNLTAFHYAELNPDKKKRIMAGALKALRAERGVLRRGTVRDARLLYADDIAATLFVRSTPSWGDLNAVHGDIEAGITSFMRFTNVAVTTYFERAAQDGTKFVEVEPNPDGGWQPARTGTGNSGSE
jgi:hypothetical protein